METAFPGISYKKVCPFIDVFGFCSIILLPASSDKN